MTIENLNFTFVSDTLTVVTARGEWSSSTEYTKGDIVQYAGSTHIAIQNVPAGENIYDTTYWQLLAQRGLTGATGNGISSIVLNADYTLTINYTDGTSDTTTSIRGATGATGATGNGIAGAVLNPDYTLTLTFTDGTTYTTPSIRGATGAKGDQGIQGVSPSVQVTDITGGHRVSVTDANGTNTFDVMDGEVSQADFEAVIPTETVSGAVANFIDGSDVIPAKSVLADINAVQSGSGTPAPGNIRPITGISEVDLTARGKNLFDSSLMKNQTSWNTINLSFPAGTVLTMSTDKGLQSDTGLYLFLRLLGDNTLSNANAVYSGHPVTLTVGENGGVQVLQRTNPDNPSPDLASEYWYQIEVGSSATAYEAYAGQVYTTQLGQTVYGGTLNVVSGELTITHDYIASYNGESLPGEWISDRDEYAQGTTPTTGAEVVYEVASPTTVQLTGQQVNILLGTNNVWADTGDVSVTYKADIQLYINKMIAAAINA